MKLNHLATLLSILLLNGCGMVGYYTQSVQGQLNILQLREPIDELIDSSTTPVELKEKLVQIKEIRQFSIEKLHLPDNDSYLLYADVGQPYVVWNVFAAPEFSLTAKNWCYFIVGCVSYRGYFDKENAIEHANLLTQQNYDVSVSGIAAYSTLGWFDDPVLNTMLNWREHHLAGLIFHELSHQVLYFKNETAFNEAFSTAVQRIATIQWLLTTNPEQISSYVEYLQAYQEFRALLKTTRAELSLIYESELDEADKRHQKAAAILKMKKNYEILKTTWPDNISFDRWFSRPINNSRFTSTMTYLEHVPAFFTLFYQANGDWNQFYETVKGFEDLEKEERDLQIDALKINAPEIEKIIELLKTKSNYSAYFKKVQ